MTFVVTENCIKCKYTDCVEVCPVDCFHEGPNFLVIDPEECIDCTRIAGDGAREVLAKGAPADADDWNGVPDKLKYLER